MRGWSPPKRNGQEILFRREKQDRICGEEAGVEGEFAAQNMRRADPGIRRIAHLIPKGRPKRVPLRTRSRVRSRKLSDVYVINSATMIDCAGTSTRLGFLFVAYRWSLHHSLYGKHRRLDPSPRPRDSRPHTVEVRSLPVECNSYTPGFRFCM